ncbi:amyloid-beta A4 precursor protein-binding family A member 2 [Aplochiton taeniatus]
MACKQPIMAYRKRPGTNGVSTVSAPCPASCPAPYPTESRDQKPLPSRARRAPYSKASHDDKPLPRPRKNLYPTPQPHDPEPDQPEKEEVLGAETTVYSGQSDPKLREQRPATPPTPEHDGHHDDQKEQVIFRDRADSLDDDSSSDYINNTSDDEDYDEGLAEEDEEDEGVTYYIRYCPEDDSYMDGPDATHHTLEEGSSITVLPQSTGHTDQEARQEGWRIEGAGKSEPDQLPWDGEEGEEEGEEGEVRCELVDQEPDEDIYEGRPEPILDHHHHHHQPPTQQEPGGGVRGGRKRLVVEGETGEEAEEDIDLIVAEIKMSMSMGSLSSATEPSPEEEPGHQAKAEPNPEEEPGHQAKAEPSPEEEPGHQAKAEPSPEEEPGHQAKAEPTQYPPAPHHRHDSRPKSLNLPSAARHSQPEPQRGFKVRPRTPDERPGWSQEQVSNGSEQPRKQQRSDLNVPLENNNEPAKKAAFPSFVDVPGPCEPEDLIDGIIFAANYLGSTQLLSERNPSKNLRMMQAQEAVSRVKSPEGDRQALTEVDLFISTQRIKVLNADSQETMMDNALRTISYIADIGNIVVLMARRRMPRTASQDCIETTPGAPEAKKQYKMICHVFESEDAQLIAQSIGQAFSVAYQEFLRANGINPEDLSQREYSDIINTQEMYNDDLIHFSNSENCKELQLEKGKGEILGVVIVESGWGSILPTVILANMMNGAPAARSGKLSIGDQIMSINNTSLVGLPLATCQGIIKGLKNQVQVKLNIVSCPPVTTVLIKRPDLKYQLGFSVQNGIICSLMRGGIAERGGVRVGHRIIEINSQSVVATAHEKIVQALSNSVGEIHMKTMPAAMFRLLTGQETPMYI